MDEKPKKQYWKYYKLTMAYANNKIWYLMLLALIPSVLISFIFSPYGTVEYLCQFDFFYQATFVEIYAVTVGINYHLFWLGIIGLVLVPFFFSILFGAVERHMRVGEFNLGFDRVRSRLNYNFATALKFTMTIFVIYQVNKFLQATMFYLFCSTLVYGAALALSIIWYIIMFFIELFTLSVIILWVPTMLQTGLNSAKALGLSVRQGIRYSPGTMLILMIPTLPMVIFMAVNSIFGLRIDVILDTILLTIASVFYVVLMYTMFFDINGVEREDLKKVDIWKKSRKKAKRRGKNGD